MGIAEGFLSHATTEEEKKFIEEELREHGVTVDTDAPGLAIMKHIGMEMVLSPKVARGQFVVSERSCQPFGVLHGGVTGLVAESIASKAAQHAAGGQQVQGIELNANHLRAVPIGETTTVIAKPMMKGGRIQVWEVKFEKEDKKKTGVVETVVAAICRVTLLVGKGVEPGDWRTNANGSKL